MCVRFVDWSPIQGIGAKANTNVPKKIDNPGLHRSVVALKDVAATATGDHTFLMLKPSGASPFLPRMLSHLSYDFICVRFGCFII